MPQTVVVELVQPSSWLVASGFEDALEVAQLALVANAQSGAMTRYAQFPFADIVRFQGEYLAVSPTGMYRLDQETGDDGAPVNVNIAFGGAELGGSNLSKATGGYFLLEGKDELTAVLENSEGYEREFRLGQRDGQKLHTRRFKGARGVWARSWSTALHGEVSGDFALHDVELLTETARRKI